ncbi:hypothetical protein D8X55_02790 [Malacoplasma penetrans]|nr:hypothetical protein [Malacoplasma penetrans]RXY96721.1 hypothetical protein D8X55_02790 [Malacoplasma penetrans]
MNKISKRISLLIINSVLSIKAGMVFLVFSNEIKNSSIINIPSINRIKTPSEIISFEYCNHNTNLYMTTQPIIFLGNKITTFDWCAIKSWDKYLSDIICMEDKYTSETLDYKKQIIIISILGFLIWKNKIKTLLDMCTLIGKIKDQININFDINVVMKFTILYQYYLMFTLGKLKLQDSISLLKHSTIYLI